MVGAKKLNPRVKGRNTGPASARVEQNQKSSEALSSTVRVKPVSLTLPEAHSQQRKFIESFDNNAKLRVIVGACGSKWGKTYGCSILIVKRAWLNHDPKHPGVPMPGPGRYWWVAPSYSQSKIAMELVKNLLPQGTYIEYRAEMRLVLIKPDGSEHSYIEFKSGDNPDSLRGFAVHFFILDEAARMPYDSFVSVWTTITQTGGKGVIISTPNGRGWFYDVYQRGEKFDEFGNPRFDTPEDDQYPDWFSIRMPTWMNPYVDLKYVEDAKRNLPKNMFEQELAAKFLQESAGCFSNIDECCRGEVENPTRGHRYIIGADLARLNDYTVLTVLDVTDHRNHVVYFDRFNDIKWQIQYRRIKALSEAYFNAIVAVDSTGIGDPIVETLQGAGVPVEPYKIGTSSAKQNLIENLRLCLEHGKVSYPKIGVLIDELRNYEYEHTAGGTIRYSAPRGKHDDAVISLALACMVADRPEWIYRHKQLRGI